MIADISSALDEIVQEKLKNKNIIAQNVYLFYWEYIV